MDVVPETETQPRRTWPRLVVALVIGVVLALRVDARAVLELLRGARAPFFLLLLVVNLGAYALMALRWGSFCRSLGLPGGYLDHLRGVFLFQVTSQVVPSPWIGEAGRLASFPAGTSKKTIFKSILLDRFSNQMALALGALLLLPYAAGLDYPRWFLVLLPLPAALLAVAVLWVRRRPAAVAGERSWRDRMSFLSELVRPRAVPLLGLGAVLSLWLGVEFYVASLVLPLAEEVPLEIVVLVPLMLLVLSLMPISFGDWGTREACALFVLAPLGLSAEVLLGTSILVGLANTLCSLPGLIWILRGRRAR